MFLDQHPVYLRMQESLVWRHGDRSWKLATQALYRTDLLSLFHSLKPQRRHHCRALAKAQYRQPRPARPRVANVDDVLSLAGFEHIRDVMENVQFYSLPRRAVRLHLMEDAMCSAREAPPPEVLPRDDGVIFVRSLHSHPSRLKTTQLPLASRAIFNVMTWLSASTTTLAHQQSPKSCLSQHPLVEDRSSCGG